MLVLFVRKKSYWISVDQLVSSGLAGKNCTNANFSMLVTNTNKHANLFENALQQSPSIIALSTMYCFRVQ